MKIWFKKPIRTAALQKMLKCSWIKVGKDHAPDHAIKEETRV